MIREQGLWGVVPGAPELVIEYLSPIGFDINEIKGVLLPYYGVISRAQ